LTLVDFDRAVFKDSNFFKNLLKGGEYLEGHDMAMMHSALEQLESVMHSTLIEELKFH
jgi:hypothetical protein